METNGKHMRASNNNGRHTNIQHRRIEFKMLSSDSHWFSILLTNGAQHLFFIPSIVVSSRFFWTSHSVVFVVVRLFHLFSPLKSFEYGSFVRISGSSTMKTEFIFCEICIELICIIYFCSLVSSASVWCISFSMQAMQTNQTHCGQLCKTTSAPNADRIEHFGWHGDGFN